MIRFRQFACLLLFCAATLFSDAAFSQAPPIAPDIASRGKADNPAPSGSLNVRDFGARGDGKTDDTAAFQAALDAASTRESVVFVPAAQYRLNGTLNVPAGVALEGSWRGPHTSHLSVGTTLLSYHGRGQENANPFISLHAGSTLKGVTIYYPEQKIAPIQGGEIPVISAQAARNWRLDIGKDADAPWIRGDWHAREPGAGTFPNVTNAMKRWSGARSIVLLPMLPNRNYTLRLYASVPPQSLQSGAHIVKVNGQEIGKLSRSGPQTFEAQIPAALVGDKKVSELLLEANTWNPRADGTSADPRQLGIGVRRVEIVAAGEDRTPVVEAEAPKVELGVVPYPWTIQGRGQQFNVLDTTIVNAWNGIDCGTYHNESHHLRNVMMCALRRGVFIDQCTDVGRLENVHIHSVYWWRANAPGTPLEPQRNFLTGAQMEALNAFTQENLEGFILGRTDWQFISGCFVIWAKIGFHFIETKSAAGGVPNVVVTQSGSDIGPLAVRIDAGPAYAGIAFQNCQFMSGVEVVGGDLAIVKFSNCGFWGPPASGSQIVMRGGGTISLANCHFHEWRPGQPCIDATNGVLLVNNSDFMFMAPGPQIRLGANVKGAAIVGNRLRAGNHIDNQSRGDVQLSANIAG